MRVVYLCWRNGLSLHNVGRALVAPMATRGITVDVVDSREWFARPTPADAALLAHTEFLWPDFPYRRYVRDLLAVVHDPDEVSTVHDRLTWARGPVHAAPALRAVDRVLTCSREMHDVLRGRLGIDAWRAATFPHDAAAIRAAATHDADDADDADDARTVRFLSTAGPMARKNRPWLDRLARALADEPRARVDFRVGGGLPPLADDAYRARLLAGDVYVCTSYMEGGPLPVMEAVLAGLAVVSTPVGQVEEWVAHGASGVLCHTYDEVEAACRAYVADPAWRRAHRARARAIGAAKTFDVDGWAAFLRGVPPTGS